MYTYNVCIIATALHLRFDMCLLRFAKACCDEQKVAWGAKSSQAKEVINSVVLAVRMLYTCNKYIVPEGQEMCK